MFRPIVCWYVIARPGPNQLVRLGDCVVSSAEAKVWNWRGQNDNGLQGCCMDQAASIAAMLMNCSGLLIVVEISELRWAIWLCMYCRNVSDDQRPIFCIVVSERPCNFMAMAPPARSECTPTKSGSMPLSARPNFVVAWRICLMM